ncbi:hypothetical protein A0H81_08184 [Grifola frondosa]|uniref:Uncharacterized protein n=1 Tax=Grifola frondosa TaxID=5627 RepID=A0A1C7M4I7_GRIFR|nr:hypothetical protein A0H81_08184 [Grifola frondosa]
MVSSGGQSSEVNGPQQHCLLITDRLCSILTTATGRKFEHFIAMTWTRHILHVADGFLGAGSIHDVRNMPHSFVPRSSMFHTGRTFRETNATIIQRSLERLHHSKGISRCGDDASIRFFGKTIAHLGYDLLTTLRISPGRPSISAPARLHNKRDEVHGQYGEVANTDAQCPFSLHGSVIFRSHYGRTIVRTGRSLLTA